MKNSGLDQIMLRPANLAIVFDLGKSTVAERISELEEWIGKGRYPRTSVVHDGKIVLVNRLAFLDYLANRQRLMSRAGAKYAEPYEPKRLSEELAYTPIPISNEQVNVYIEDHKGKKARDQASDPAIAS